MPNSVHTQNALANEPAFINRVKGALLTHALTVFGEAQSTPPTTTETVRRNYAHQVMNSSDAEAQRVARIIVYRANVNNFATSYDFVAGAVVTASGDPDVLSQVATDWNIYARV